VSTKIWLIDAINHYEQALKCNPNYAEAHKNLSSLKNYKNGDPQILLMQEAVSNPEITDKDRKYLCFALAKVNEDLDNKDDLFNYLNEGNRLRKEELGYSIEYDRKEFATIKEIFSIQHPVVDITNLSEQSKIQPIFIVGMPRSGTTLVEQILASHSKVYGAGEQDTLRKLASKLLSKHSTKAIQQHKSPFSKDTITSIRKEYLATLSSLDVPERIITDKMPDNFKWIGLILSALPEAKIIHLIRDARATCWSNYKSYFTRKGIGFAYDFSDLAEYYQLYSDLMRVWHQHYPEKIYDLCYEELTENQEEETQKLLHYCGIDWEEQCLAFHENNRPIITLSALQVRQKMYQGSSEAWKKYENYLQPLIKLVDR